MYFFKYHIFFLKKKNPPKFNKALAIRLIFDSLPELDINKNEATIFPINTSDNPAPAKRPKKSLLKSQETSRRLELNGAHWRKNLRDILIEYKKIKKV